MRNSEEAQEQAIYEVCYLILPSIAEESLSSVTDSIRKAISKEGGQEIDAEEPFKHPLAYEMSKTVGSSKYVIDEAYIGWIKFEVEPSAVPAIKEALEKVKELVRFLIVKASRETVFTFAKARAAAEEKLRAQEEALRAETEAESSESPESDSETEEAAAPTLND